MRTWLVPVVLVLAGLWVWWMRRTLRAKYLQRLVVAAKGSPRRARVVTLAWQTAVALTGVLLIAAAALAQAQWGLDAVRIPLLLLVIALIVPLGSIASGRDASVGRQRRVQVRRSVQQRLTDVGASGEVADVVVRTSKPYAYVSFALGLVAAFLLVWRG